MMENSSLPPELLRLEQQLAARPRPQPRAGQKLRFVQSVRAELYRQRAGARWAFAAAVAASALVWLNLSLSASQATDCGLRLADGAESIETTADEIRRLVPELPPREAMRQAVLLRAGAGVVACPRPSGSGIEAVRRDEWMRATY